MSLNKRKNKNMIVAPSLSNNDLYIPTKENAKEIQHDVLYMIPSTKYQYEKDGEKALSPEYEYMESKSSGHYINGTVQPQHYQPMAEERYVVTPELTTSSAKSSIRHHSKRVGITLVDNPVPNLDEMEDNSAKKTNNKLSTFIIRLKAIFLFKKNIKK